MRSAIVLTRVNSLRHTTIKRLSDFIDLRAGNCGGIENLRYVPSANFYVGN